MAAAKPTGGRSLYIQNGEDRCALACFWIDFVCVGSMD